MIKKMAYFSMMFILAIYLCGCATTHRQNELETQALRNQILVLENQLQQKDQEIEGLKESIKTEEQPTVGRAIGEVKARPTVRQIQTALKNAGYNSGGIDGRMGKQTRDAIKQFQKANDLSADGKVGKRTWDSLKEYLYKKTK